MTHVQPQGNLPNIPTPHAPRPSDLSALFDRLWQRRELLVQLTWREMSAGHTGHRLGLLWLVIHPFVLVCIYLFVFGFVFGGQLKAADQFPGNYPSYLLIGLVPWLAMQAAIIRSTTALISNANLVKQVVFPIEVLPIASALAASLPYIPAFVLVLLYRALNVGGFDWALVLLPVVMLLHLVIAVGLGFALSAVTTFLRDLKEVISVLCTIAMSLSPAVYLPDWAPAPLRPLIYVNPFSYLTWVYQDVLFFGQVAHPWAWVITAALAAISLSVGYRLFARLKPYYGNVL